MNCQELRGDIEKLRNEQQKLRELLDNAQDKAMIRSIEEKVDSLGDSILEKYMEGFFEKNPEIARWSPKSLERLETRKGIFQSTHNILAIAPTQDGGMLVGGSGGVICEYRKEGDVWNKNLLETLMYKDVHNRIERPTQITAILSTSDDEALVCGSNGVINEYRKEGDAWTSRSLERLKYNSREGRKYSTVWAIAPTLGGEVLVGTAEGVVYELKKEDGVWKTRQLERLTYIDKDKTERYAFVWAIAPTADGEMLVGGNDGMIYEFTKEGDNWSSRPLEKLQFGLPDKDVGGYDDYELPVTIISPTPDGGMLVGGSYGMMYELKKENGIWKSKQLERLTYRDDNGGLRHSTVMSISSTPDGGMLVGGNHGAMCEYKKEEGEWKVVPLEKLKYVDKDGHNYYYNVLSIAPTENGGMFVGGLDGVLSEYTKPPRSLETLKEHLMEIAEKGEA